MRFPRLKKHIPLRPSTVTAKSRDLDYPDDLEITIQALHSYPELLSRPLTRPSRFKKRPKAHEYTCECDSCEYGEETPELDF